MAAIDELFLKRLLVLTKSQDREERKTHISVAVEVHTTVTPVHKKELIVRLTDESDLFFLYTLKLSEEDFQSLKTQQGLLVDFAAFPQKFIDLLELCLQEEPKDSPKFIIHLVSNGTTGTSTANLNLIETNPFKHLVHLSLKFLPGTDGDVKKYLAHCLKTLKDQNQLLLHRLEHTEADLSQQLRQAREALSNRTAELDALRHDWTAKTNDLSTKHVHELTAEKERALQAKTSAQQQLEREKREMETTHNKVIKQLEVRCYDLETSNKELVDKKYKSEATIRELRSRLSLVEEENTRYKTEVATLRKDNTNFDHDLHEQEKVVHQLRTRLAVVEQEVKDKEEVMKRTSDLLGTEQDHKKKQDDDLDKKKRHISKLEGTIKKMSEDVIKGNEIIKKLQGEIKHYHSKLKLRNQVTTEQEKLLVEKNREMEEIRRELEESKTQLRHRDEENKKLNESLEGTMSKLEESRQLLKTNENVINWLNKQVTETQLHQQRGHGPFEMSNSATSYKPLSGPMHNFSAPSTSFGVQSTISRTSSAPVGHHSNTSPPAAASQPNRPHVHYNPGQPRKSALPIPIAKSSPIGTIPEEPTRTGDVQASPALTQNKNKQQEPFLDAKYFQSQGGGGGGDSDAIPLRGASTAATRTISPTPFRLTTQTPPMAPASASATAQLPSTRLSRDVIVPRNNPKGGQSMQQPPLASAYFPGQTKVS